MPNKHIKKVIILICLLISAGYYGWLCFKILLADIYFHKASSIIKTQPANHQEIISYLTRTLQLLPAKAEYHYQLGQTLENQFKSINNSIVIKEKLTTQSLNHYSKTCQYAPTFARAWYKSGVIYLAKKNYSQAAGHFSKANTLNANHWNLKFKALCGFFFLWRQTHNKTYLIQAIDGYQKLIKNHPHRFLTIINFLWRYHCPYEKMTSVIPPDPQFHFIFGQFLYSKNDKVNSGRAYQKAIILSENKPRMYDLVAQEYFKHHDYLTAISFWQKKSDLKPEAKTYYYLAKSYQASREFERAEELCNEALSLSPQNVQFRLTRAQLYLQKGELRKSETEYRQIGFKHTDYRVDSFLGLAQIAATKKNYLQAIRYVKKICSIMAQEKKYRRYLNRLVQQGIENWENLIRVDPENAWLYFKLGQIYEENQDTKTAIKKYQQAIKIKPDFLTPEGILLKKRIEYWQR